MSNKEINPRQISVKKTNKSGIELINKLKIATPGKGCYIHKSGEKDEATGDKIPNSMIGINIWDYSKENTEFVSDNLKPVDIKEICNESLMRRKEYQFSGNGYKIFGKPDEKGMSIARYMMISRQTAYSDRTGKIITKKLPWRFEIKNGKGKMIKTQTGGQQMEAGTFVSEKSAVINLSDADVLELFQKALDFIRLWEDYHRDEFIRQTIEKIEEADQNHRNYSSASNPQHEQNTEQQKPKGNYFPREQKPQMPTDAKAMSICFKTAFGESTDPKLMYAEATCYAGTKSSECIVWFERSKLGSRMDEFTDAMEHHKKVRIFYKIKGKDIYFVA